MKRFTFLISSIICIIALLLGIAASAGCATKAPEAVQTPSQPAKTFDLTICNQHPMEDPMNGVINVAWAKWLDEESNGRIKLTILPSAQAAPGDELYDAARTGIVNIACQGFGLMPGRFVAEEVSELPLMFDWPASADSAMTLMSLYEKFPWIQEQHNDVKVLLYHMANTTHIHTIKKPVHTMADMKGMVIAVTGPNHAAIVERLGGSPVLMNIADIYDALAKGVVEGNIDNWTCSMIFNWGELWNYSTEASLCSGGWIHVMNLDTWNSMPSELQNLFVGENAWRMIGLYGYLFDKTEGDIRAALEKSYLAKGKDKIYTLPDSEKAKWAELIMPIRDEWLKKAEAAGAPAQDILDTAIAFSQQYAYKTLQTSEWQQKQVQLLHDWGATGY